MPTDPTDNILGVAEAKSRFSELIDRVEHGERFVITRRGKPVLALVCPDQAVSPRIRPGGLASIAGALAEWDDLPSVVGEIYTSRRHARSRDVPGLD